MTMMARHPVFDIDGLFENLLSGAKGVGDTQGVYAPRVDIDDKPDYYEISAELPGIRKNDVNVTLDNGVLTIEAESKKAIPEEQAGRVIRQERKYGRFVRSFNLGEAVAQEGIEAAFEDGILILKAPKQKPAVPEKKKIEIA